VEDGDDEARDEAPIRPLALSPDFFHGFGTSARDREASRGALQSPVTPVTPNIRDDKPQRVIPGLYIGALEAARNIKALRRAGITSVLTLGVGMDLPENDQITAQKVVEVSRGPRARAASALANSRAAILSPPYRQVEDKDREAGQLAEHLSACLNFIDDSRASGGSVLVHCLAGRSRSASVVVAYLMGLQKCGVDEALELLKKTRCARARPGPP
jgi:hypothetical protein